MLLEESAAADCALELVDLARSLRLTKLQIDFVLALVADPKCNQTKAAMSAGASTRTAHIWACKTLKLAKVTKAATERARERALASPAVRQVEEAVMQSAEHQLRLSRMGRADIGRHLAIQDGNVEVRIDPAYTDIIREVRVEERADKDGMPVRRTTIKVVDPVPALQALARVKGWENHDSDGGGMSEVWQDVLRELPSETLAADAHALDSGLWRTVAPRWWPKSPWISGSTRFRRRTT